MEGIMNYIRRLFLLSVTALFVTSALQAQNLYVKVGETYKVTAADDGKRVGDMYPVGQDTLQVANGRPGLYWAWQFWKAKGMTYATFRTRYLGCAIANDIAWRYEWDGNIKSGFQNVYAFADWTDASGHWYANATMCLPRAGMKGLSSFGHYDDTNTSQIFASLEFEMTEDWWPANQTERHLFETPNSSLDGANFYSYNEAFSYTGMHLTGPAVYGDGIKRVGMFLRRPGECSKIDQINASMFQYGIVIQGPTPIEIGTITVFWNEIIGAAFMGSWGATWTAAVISGDSNGELVGIHPGYGEEGGGTGSFGVLKNEDGILAESAVQPWRGQITLYAEGQYAIEVDVANNSRNSILTDAIFVVNPRLTNGSPQGSVLKVGPHKGFRYRTTLQNLATGKRWEAPADYQGRTFTHYANGDRMFIDDVQVPGLPCNCPPLGFFRGNGTFDYVNCLPARTGGTTTNPGPVNPPPPPPPVDPPPPPVTMTATAFKEDCMEAGSVRAPSFMLDGKDNTFWMGCASMTATGSQWVTITLPTAQSLKGLTFTKPIGYNDSWPRTFTVELSANGTNYAAPLKFTGTATGCAATWPAQMVKAARIKCTSAAAGAWWGINTLTVQ